MAGVSRTEPNIAAKNRSSAPWFSQQVGKNIYVLSVIMKWGGGLSPPSVIREAIFFSLKTSFMIKRGKISKGSGQSRAI